MRRDAPRPLGFSARYVIVAVTVLGIGGLCRLQATQGAKQEVQEPAFSLSTRPPALRPPRALSLDIGTPSARASLFAGFGADLQRERRTEVLAVGAARVGFDLAPDGSTHRLTVTARSTNVGVRKVKLTLNGSRLGEVEIGPSAGRGLLDVPGPLLVSGHNELVLEPDAEIAVDRIDLVPSSGSTAGDPRDPAISDPPCRSARAPAPSADLPCALPAKKEGQLFVELHPYGQSYVLGLSGRPGVTNGASTLRLLVNGVPSGELRLGSDRAGALVFVPVARLKVGVNVLETALIDGSPATLESFTLRPATDHESIDVGVPAARPHLLSGFSNDEPCESGRCVWSSGPSSRVLFGLVPRARRYRLTIAAQAFVAVTPLEVTLAINGKPAGRMEWGAAVETRELEIPEGLLKPGINEIALSYARTAEPSLTLPGSTDPRPLALRYDWIEIFPIDGE